MNTDSWGVALIGTLLLGILGFGIVNATHVEHHTCTILDKDRTSSTDKDGNTKSDARVYTRECGVFKVSDSLLSLTWSSSDTYAHLERGKKYNLTTRGFRIPFFSKFPNVVEVKEVRK